MSNEKAVAAWMARKSQIDAILKRLAEASDEHFDMDPESIHWGDVGSIAHIADALQEAADCLFHEGEYAPEAK